MGQWSELPMVLLKSIEEHVILYADKVHLRSVCAPWRSKLSMLYHQQPCQSPCLLLAYENNVVTSCGLFSLFDKRLYQVDLPESPQGKLFKGSSCGWVVTFGDFSSLCAVNPLTGAQVKLPPRSSFPDVVKYRSDKHDHEYAIRDRNQFFTIEARHVRNFLTTKIVLSVSPTTTDDYLAVAIYGEAESLAYCGKGYKKWLHLHGDLWPYVDVNFFRGLLYALDCNGKLVIFKFGACLQPELTNIMKPVRDHIFHAEYNKYLVVYSDGLMMVERIFRCCQTIGINSTSSFKIFKLDEGVPSWIEVKDIGGDALFWGLNSTSLVSSSDYSGCKGNCIYFTDDSLDIYDREGIQEVDLDMGIYDLNDGHIDTLPIPRDYKCDGKNMFWPPPIWVVPKTY